MQSDVQRSRIVVSERVSASYIDQFHFYKKYTKQKTIGHFMDSDGRKLLGHRGVILGCEISSRKRGSELMLFYS